MARRKRGARWTIRHVENPKLAWGEDGWHPDNHYRYTDKQKTAMTLDPEAFWQEAS